MAWVEGSFVLVRLQMVHHHTMQLLEVMFDVVLMMHFLDLPDMLMVTRMMRFLGVIVMPEVVLVSHFLGVIVMSEVLLGMLVVPMRVLWVFRKYING